MMNMKRQSRRGITTVEFALLLPILFFLVMGIIETGNMFSAWMTIQKAAQSGARFATTGIGDEDGSRLNLIVEETEQWLVALNGDKTVEVRSWPTTDVLGDGNSGDPGGPCGLVEVGVTYDYTPITPVFEALLEGAIELTSHERKLNEPWKPCDG